MSTRTVPTIGARKVRSGGEPLVMVTAYDAPGARHAHAADVDLVLVGDTLAMVVLGYDDTLRVDVDDIAHHVGAVRRGLDASTAEGPRPVVIGDLPWMSYHTGTEDAVRSSAALVRAGAEAVKLEGGRKRVGVIEAIIDAEIPVMGHVGLTPQSIHAVGGFKVQGRDHAAALALLDDAKALAAAGCFAIVLEAVPAEVARMVTSAVDVPTIGIGAGPDCDGQVLVYHDVVGLETRLRPRFVRRYAELGDAATTALRTYAADVRARQFPDDSESYRLPSEVADNLEPYS